MIACPWQHLHFVGIGGVGMAGLALICRECGVAVSGSDAADSANAQLLRDLGADVRIGHRAAHLPAAAELLIYSSAVPDDNPERAAAVARGLPQRRRGEFLAQLAQSYETVVSIAGSHGKTTVSAMLAYVLLAAGRAPGYLVGGKVNGLPRSAAAGDGKLLVTEVDESDGTQALMRSTHAIITNIEDDHCWSVGGEAALQQCFLTFAQRTDQVFAWATPPAQALLTSHPNVTFLDEADIDPRLQLQLPGQHNRSNATLAVAVAAALGVPHEDSLRLLQQFAGVDRRQSMRWQGATGTVIEDYAHHPTEVRATLQAMREGHPQARLRVVFQPHRFERIARYADDFARELSAADEVVVTAPFAAWVDDAALADPRRIAAEIAGTPARYFDADYQILASELSADAAADDLFLILGAGSITALVPLLVQALQSRDAGTMVDAETGVADVN